MSNTMNQGTTAIFSYSVGDVEAITQGVLQKTRITRESGDYRRLLQNTESRSAMPSVVGIYQQNILPQARTPQEERKLEALLARMNDLLDADIQRYWNIRDPLHRGLIHIGYDKNTVTQEQLTACVTDPLKRIRISPLDRLPSFSQKDVALFDRLIDEYGKQHRAIDKPVGDVMKHRSILESLRQQFEVIKEQWNPFGLTREDWYYLSWHDIFATYEQRN